MKKILPGVLVLCVLAVAACTNADKKSTAETGGLTTILWVDSTYKNLGKVTEGSKVEVTFFFKNTGDKPLVISGATASCGCTVPNPPKDPVAPGQEGKITAEFNSEGRHGLNTKEIYVTANTTPAPNHTLTFQLEVEKKN